jgi:hypothetical protein
LEPLLIELLTRTLCDTLPAAQLDGAYLFAQTADNQQSVFATALDLFRQQQVKKILISGAKPISGYPGFAAWQQELVSLGLPEVVLTAVPPTDPSVLHTRIEAESLVRWAREQNYGRLVVVAPPFQQLRAFMTAVSLVLEQFPDLQIYNQVGAALPWREMVVHSQGKLHCERRELIQHELDRIKTYQDKGDLAPTQTVLIYLNQRNCTLN